MTKLFTRTSVAGPTLSGANLLSTLTALYDALRSLGVTAANRTTVTASATLTTDQTGLLLVDCSAGSVTLTLPSSGTATDEAEFRIRRIDTTSGNTLTVQRGGTDTIEGVATAQSVAVGGQLDLKLPAGSTNWRITGREYLSGQVLQQQTYALDVGATTTNLTLVNVSAGTKSITPRSTNSILLVECAFFGATSIVASTNHTGYFQLMEGGVAVGSSYGLEIADSAGGSRITAPLIVRARLTNSALTARGFTLGAYSSTASGSVAGQTQYFTITEIQA